MERPAHKITVHNRQRTLRVPLPVLQKFADRALRECLKIARKNLTELDRNHDLHVILVSDRRIAEVHRRFLHLSGPTDVITFHHGEIFISAETARRQAGQFGTSMTKELCLYIVHGLLHLHRFDDTTRSPGERMKRVQDEIVRVAKLPGMPGDS